MKSRQVPLKEIARKANISAPLVSCILNGKGRASEEVRTRVSKMLKEAGYRPKYARKPFLFVTDYPQSAIFGDDPTQRLLAGIQSLLMEEDCLLLVEFLPHDQPNDTIIKSHFEQIAQRSPGGVFINTGAKWLGLAAEVFGKAKIPIVQVGFDKERPGCDAIVVDSFRGAHTAVTFLVSQGHTRIATIRWNARHISNSNLKHAGYLAALADANISVRPEYIVGVTSYQGEPGWVLSRTILEQMLALPEPPTALFVENCALSLSLLYPLTTDNGQIPQSICDVTMVHFEDLCMDPFEDALARRMSFPARETYFVAIDWWAIGRMGARTMLDRLSNPQDSLDRTIRVSPGLQKLSGMTRTEIKLSK